jgi:hypothetical protein
MAFEQLIDGKGTTVPNKQIWRFMCCDCGLVHNVSLVADSEAEGQEIGIAMARNHSATKRRRSSRKAKLAMHTNPHQIRKGKRFKTVWDTQIFEVAVLAVCEPYAMIRHKGCMPFIAPLKDLTFL